MTRPGTPALASSAALSILVVLGATVVSSSLLNDDTAWYLHMAGVWLDGGRLYRDVIDTNPPLIVFLTAAPVGIARLLHVAGTLTFKAFIFVLAGGSVALSVAGIRRTWTDEWDRGLILSALVFSFLLLVGSDFGQREHVAVVLVAPYVFSSCAWLAGRPLPRGADWAAAVAAGLGFALKPYFMAGWLAVEVCLLLAGRTVQSLRRPGPVGVVIVQLVYALVIVTLVPDYLSVARDALQVYSALNAASSQLAGLIDVRLWLLALLALAIPTEPPFRRARLVLFAVATGFLAEALVQSKGWPYQFYPFRAFIMLFLAAWLPAVFQHPPLKRFASGARLAPAVVLVAVMAWSGRAAMRRAEAGEGFVRAFIELVERQPRHESFAVLSMRNIVWPAFPAANYTGSEWVLRHNSLWFMPGFYDDDFNRARGSVAYHALATMPPIERRYFEHIVDDLCRRPPRLLVIQPPVPDLPAGGRSIDLVGYYRQDARFARLFGGYGETETLGAFTVFTRRTDVPCSPGQ